MAKAKVITALALTVVMLVVMTGLAAADDEQIDDQMDIVKDGTNIKVTSVDIPLGGTVNLDINISNFLKPAGTIHNLTVELYDTNSSNPVTGLQLNISEQDGDGPKPTGTWNAPADNPVVRWNQTPGAGGYERFDLTIKETKGACANYIVRIADTETGNSVELSAATMGVNAVPEFTTIAIPVAAILGLLFFYNHRKRKEE